MISIIISSYQDDFYAFLEKNITETIGISYEIIKIHNPGLIGICEAYNNGASRAKYDNLLFIHEDILFLNHNWGELLVNHLNRKSTGVIGLAGSNYVPVAPCAWSLSDSKYTFGNVNNKERLRGEKQKIVRSAQRVFGLDGVFLAARKPVYNEFRFDEDIKGFHGYDTDFSLRVATKYNNYVIWDVFIKHFSKGNPDKIYLDNHMLIRRKISQRFNKIFDEELEINMFRYFLSNYFSYYKCSIKNIQVTLKFFPRKISLTKRYPILKAYLIYFYVYNFRKHLKVQN